MKPAMLPALLILASLSAPVSALPPAPEGTGPAPAPILSYAVPVDAAPAIPVRPERKSPMLNDSELETQRGGQSLVITNQTMESLVSGNVLKGDYTAGAVTLSDFALSNFNGVGNLLINTGAQVSAQSGMNLTINLGD
jgi:hypothetical protein